MTVLQETTSAAARWTSCCAKRWKALCHSLSRSLGKPWQVDWTILPRGTIQKTKIYTCQITNRIPCKVGLCGFWRYSTYPPLRGNSSMLSQTRFTLDDCFWGPSRFECFCLSFCLKDTKTRGSPAVSGSSFKPRPRIQFLGSSFYPL